MSATSRRELGWPAAATIISAMIGAVAASIALAIVPGVAPELGHTHPFTSAREIGEVKARLEGIENSNRQLRIELREDMKELRKLIQVALDTNR